MPYGGFSLPQVWFWIPEASAMAAHSMAEDITTMMNAFAGPQDKKSLAKVKALIRKLSSTGGR